MPVEAPKKIEEHSDPAQAPSESKADTPVESTTAPAKRKKPVVDKDGPKHFAKAKEQLDYS